MRLSQKDKYGQERLDFGYPLFLPFDGTLGCYSRLVRAVHYRAKKRGYLVKTTIIPTLNLLMVSKLENNVPRGTV